MDHKRAFQILNMPPRTYVVTRGIPIGVVGLLFAVGAFFVAPAFLPGAVAPILPLVVLAFFVGLAAMYPLAAADRKRAEIDNALPFFMTHFGVLSTANMPRTEVFRILGEKKEYKALATELRRIYSLVTDWNMALPEAARFVSRTTPSQIFGDFLERLAHAMETGQSLEIFLRSEQSVVMKEYSTLYETAIYQIENWKDIYMSTVMSGAFFVIFAIITPVLTGNDPQTLMLGTLGFVLFMEVLLLLVLRMRLPVDQLWHSLDIATPERRMVRRSTFLMAALVPVLFLILFMLTSLSLGIALVASITPLAASGYISRGIEEKIKRREENYGAFIRSLGASAAARGGSLREVLKQVQNHNFGPLTELIRNLYARLSWRLDETKSWKYFSAESGSHLIDSFTSMFVEGLNAGGKPDLIGDIISENVVRIMNLRKSRYSTAGTFRGLLIGLTASMAFIMFLGVGILGVLGDIFGVAASNIGESDLTPVSLDFGADVGLISTFVFWLMLAHGLIAAITLKMVDGGAWPAGLLLFVIMMWIVAALSFASTAILPSVFNFGA